MIYIAFIRIFSFSLAFQIHSLPENHELLSDIASMFATVGMCKQAVSAYTKTGKVCLRVCKTVMGVEGVEVVI